MESHVYMQMHRRLVVINKMVLHLCTLVTLTLCARFTTAYVIAHTVYSYPICENCGIVAHIV